MIYFDSGDLMTDKYFEIINHYENCFNEHGDTHKGVDWPNLEDAKKRYKVMSDIFINKNNISILDFGCGVAHFYDFLINNINIDFNYTGLDISPVFIEACRKKYPSVDFLCFDILKNPEYIEKPFDYCILNGVFTEKRNLDYDEMFEYMKSVLLYLFKNVKVGLAFNLMSKNVDWERDDLFHVPFDSISQFIYRNLSRHFVIRSDYGLYEYTIYIYKKEN